MQKQPEPSEKQRRSQKRREEEGRGERGDNKKKTKKDANTRRIYGIEFNVEPSLRVWTYKNVSISIDKSSERYQITCKVLLHPSLMENDIEKENFLFKNASEVVLTLLESGYVPLSSLPSWGTPANGTKQVLNIHDCNNDNTMVYTDEEREVVVWPANLLDRFPRKMVRVSKMDRGPMPDKEKEGPVFHITVFASHKPQQETLMTTINKTRQLNHLFEVIGCKNLVYQEPLHKDPDFPVVIASAGESIILRTLGIDNRDSKVAKQLLLACVFIAREMRDDQCQRDVFTLLTNSYSDNAQRRMEDYTPDEVAKKLSEIQAKLQENIGVNIEISKQPFMLLPGDTTLLTEPKTAHNYLFRSTIESDDGMKDVFKRAINYSMVIQTSDIAHPPPFWPSNPSFYTVNESRVILAYFADILFVLAQESACEKMIKECDFLLSKGKECSLSLLAPIIDHDAGRLHLFATKKCENRIFNAISNASKGEGVSIECFINAFVKKAVRDGPPFFLGASSDQTKTLLQTIGRVAPHYRNSFLKDTIIDLQKASLPKKATEGGTPQQPPTTTSHWTGTLVDFGTTKGGRGGPRGVSKLKTGGDASIPFKQPETSQKEPFDVVTALRSIQSEKIAMSGLINDLGLNIPMALVDLIQHMVIIQKPDNHKRHYLLDISFSLWMHYKATLASSSETNDSLDSLIVYDKPVLGSANSNKPCTRIVKSVDLSINPDVSVVMRFTELFPLSPDYVINLLNRDTRQGYTSHLLKVYKRCDKASKDSRFNINPSEEEDKPNHTWRTQPTMFDERLALPLSFFGHELDCLCMDIIEILVAVYVSDTQALNLPDLYEASTLYLKWLLSEVDNNQRYSHTRLLLSICWFIQHFGHKSNIVVENHLTSLLFVIQTSQGLAKNLEKKKESEIKNHCVLGLVSFFVWALSAISHHTSTGDNPVITATLRESCNVLLKKRSKLLLAHREAFFFVASRLLMDRKDCCSMIDTMRSICALDNTIQLNMFWDTFCGSLETCGYCGSEVHKGRITGWLDGVVKDCGTDCRCEGKGMHNIPVGFLYSDRKYPLKHYKKTLMDYIKDVIIPGEDDN